LQDPILKKTYHKKLLVEWLKVRSWVQTPVPHTQKTFILLRLSDCMGTLTKKKKKVLNTLTSQAGEMPGSLSLKCPVDTAA
jgi:hypothetical protein